MQLLLLRLLLAVVASVAASSSGGSAVGGHGSSRHSDEDCPASNMAIFILGFCAFGGTVLFFHFNGPCSPRPRWQDKLCEPHLWATAPNPHLLLIVIILAVAEVILGLLLVRLPRFGHVVNVDHDDATARRAVNCQLQNTDAGGGSAAHSWGIAHIVLGIWTIFWTWIAFENLKKYLLRHRRGARPPPRNQAANQRSPASAVSAQAVPDVAEVVRGVVVGQAQGVVVGQAQGVEEEAVVPRGAASVPLKDLCGILREELGTGERLTLPEIVEFACRELAVTNMEGRTLVDRANACYVALGSPPLVMQV